MPGELTRIKDWIMSTHTRKQFLDVITHDKECWEKYVDIRVLIDNNYSYQENSYLNDLRPEIVSDIDGIIDVIDKRVMYLLLSGN